MAALAARQHGVIAHRQLVGLGVGRGTIRRWRDSGRLHRVHARVYAVGHARLTVRGRWMAAVLACPEGTLLSHGDAGALWNLIAVPGSRPHVTVPSAGTRRRSGLVVHETARFEPEESAVRDAIPVTSVARTLLDVAESEPNRLPRVWDAAERLRLLDVRAVERTCERGHGRRGLKHLLPLVKDRTRVVGDTRRELEARFFELCRRCGLPLPSCNVLVEGFLVDALWPGQRLIVELDSWEFHRERRAFEDDRTRDAALMAAGYRVVRITWRRLEHKPAEVAALIRKLLGP
ncbi:MAG: hypothetical protein QOJ57_127 [Thermoleophilaceae bacterium]|nr:hypothetical protein [Thermoleophilaceae bacterium]